jgi:hypothetical protein
LCAFVLPSLSSLARADEPSLADWVHRRVDEGLVKPLARVEGSRFSRARPVPRERRVRALQAAATPDKSGRSFVPFAVDVRFGSEWHKDDILGCAYPGTGALFVKIGDSYRPAEFLLGKNVEPVAGVCEAAPAPRA